MQRPQQFTFGMLLRVKEARRSLKAWRPIFGLLPGLLLGLCCFELLRDIELRRVAVSSGGVEEVEVGEPIAYYTFFPASWKLSRIVLISQPTHNLVAHELSAQTGPGALPSCAAPRSYSGSPIHRRHVPQRGEISSLFFNPLLVLFDIPQTQQALRRARQFPAEPWSTPPPWSAAACAAHQARRSSSAAERLVFFSRSRGRW